MTFYDEEILSSSKNLIELNTSDNNYAYFDILEKYYPIVGSKVNWQKTKKNKYKLANSKKIKEEYISFFNEVIESINLKNKDYEIVYFGDDLTELCYFLRLKHIEKFISLIIDIPQHHYFMSHDGKWCISFTLENDLEFGISPNL